MVDIYKDWCDICLKIVNENIIDWKSKTEVKYMLEHVHFELGKLYLKNLKDKLSLEIIKELCNENDLFGGTEKYTFSDNIDASPSTLRYISQAYDILKYISNKQLKSVKLIEIGSGYGGLCLILHRLSKEFKIKIEKYIIYDLPEVQKLQEYYLSNFADVFGNVQFSDCNTFGEDLEENNNNILISNYALSEIDISFRKKYLRNLLPKLSGFYMIWNSESEEGLPFSINEEPENPQTGFCNKVLWL